MKPDRRKPHIARKRFGQHFLKDERVLQKIVSVFLPKEDQNIVEIGPGLGALTNVLLDRIDHLSAIELDRDLVKHLKQQYYADRISIYEMDVLQCDLSKIERSNEAKALRLIGNLPYNISTPLIFHLLDQLDQIEDMLFMLQKEVALRLAAKPGNKHYGRLTVMTSLRADCECLIDVPPDAFDPPPKVESTVVQLKPKKSLQQDFDLDHLRKLVTAAFGQRRKTLRNALSSLVTIQQFKDAELDPSLRAESVSPDMFVRLSNICSR